MQGPAKKNSMKFSTTLDSLYKTPKSTSRFSKSNGRVYRNRTFAYTDDMCNRSTPVDYTHASLFYANEFIASINKNVDCDCEWQSHRNSAFTSSHFGCLLAADIPLKAFMSAQINTMPHVSKSKRSVCGSVLVRVREIEIERERERKKSCIQSHIIWL